MCSFGVLKLGRYEEIERRVAKRIVAEPGQRATKQETKLKQKTILILDSADSQSSSKISKAITTQDQILYLADLLNIFSWLMSFAINHLRLDSESFRVDGWVRTVSNQLAPGGEYMLLDNQLLIGLSARLNLFHPR